ncbi:MAG: NAD(P)-binding protein [Gammaproteobacteria bacterium]|nr:NAD(P)-binding protein [Gammaproteobacteria bacterium]MBU1732461.1 NAD(P)-binding protein [Gammaproteobacteria bacterium]MBU1894031.1 NAD(P)-binding protein [Gammaproteobacteria bacterium]
MNRRDFLLSLAATSCIPGCQPQTSARLPNGEMLGPSMERGHLLRGRDFPAPSETRKTGVAIVGGGIAGLSAAWKLNKSGFGDFHLLELEYVVGGNSRSGKNAVSAYPWGAHYLPLPGVEARETRELLSDLGVLQGDPYAETPSYDERYLCFAPQERLYRNGLWQEGILPQIGATKTDLEQYRRFFDLLEQFRQRRGASGSRAFAIPAARSARDADLMALDGISMRQFLLQHKLDSSPLHWYVNYGCRDDYGSDYAIVSAWAGLHYFASRNGLAENAESDQVLTWPEGNDWLVKQMQKGFSERIVSGALVHRMEETKSHVELDIFLHQENRSVRWQADQVIFAAPMFVLPHMFEGLDESLKQACQQIRYAPWLVANLTLNSLPNPGHGAPLSWDNVLYDSPALGYINATHQSLRTHEGPTVLTYYRALSGEPDKNARQRLFDTPRQQWADSILQDLSRPHPDIRSKVTQLDLFRWGHAMSMPMPGWIWSAARERLTVPHGRLHLAHSDLSGFSIFEEANYWGVKAASNVLWRLGFIPWKSL